MTGPHSGAIRRRLATSDTTIASIGQAPAASGTSGSGGDLR